MHGMENIRYNPNLYAVFLHFEDPTAIYKRRFEEFYIKFPALHCFIFNITKVL
jgi:hypothetical protein